MGIITGESSEEYRCRCGRIICLETQDKEYSSFSWLEYRNGEDLEEVKKR